MNEPKFWKSREEFADTAAGRLVKMSRIFDANRPYTHWSVECHRVPVRHLPARSEAFNAASETSVPKRATEYKTNRLTGCVACHPDILEEPAGTAHCLSRRSIPPKEPRMSRHSQIWSNAAMREIGCSTGHGRIDKMPLTKVNTLYTQWCAECHRDTSRPVRLRIEVFNPAYETSVPNLVAAYPIQSLTDCVTCHR